MRAVFLGTPEFAVPALKKLLENSYEVCGVFTQPDRPSGRGQKMQPSPVKVIAQAHGVPVFQPHTIKQEENRAIFNNLQPDFIVVVAYGQILPGWLLDSARIAPINIHASLLPQYRGAAPIAWAIMKGETETGVTTMIMREKLDSGPVLMQQKVRITDTATAGELSKELSEIGADLLIRTLDALKMEALHPAEQEERLVTWAPRITKAIAHISWEMRARELHDLIRGLNPWPVAYVEFRGERLHIWRGLPCERSPQSTTGTFLGLSDDGILVQCGDGTILNLLEVQMPGKTRITGRQFASGARLRIGDVIA
jgi:methionyl-tRNA formyltransferase